MNELWNRKTFEVGALPLSSLTIQLAAPFQIVTGRPSDGDDGDPWAAEELDASRRQIKSRTADWM